MYKYLCVTLALVNTATSAGYINEEHTIYRSKYPLYFDKSGADSYDPQRSGWTKSWWSVPSVSGYTNTITYTPIGNVADIDYIEFNVVGSVTGKTYFPYPSELKSIRHELDVVYGAFGESKQIFGASSLGKSGVSTYTMNASFNSLGWTEIDSGFNVKLKYNGWAGSKTYAEDVSSNKVGKLFVDMQAYVEVLTHFKNEQLPPAKFSETDKKRAEILGILAGANKEATQAASAIIGAASGKAIDALSSVLTYGASKACGTVLKDCDPDSLSQLLTIKTVAEQAKKVTGAGLGGLLFGQISSINQQLEESYNLIANDPPDGNYTKLEGFKPEGTNFENVFGEQPNLSETQIQILSDYISVISDMSQRLTIAYHSLERYQGAWMAGDLEYSEKQYDNYLLSLSEHNLLVEQYEVLRPKVFAIMETLGAMDTLRTAGQSNQEVTDFYSKIATDVLDGVYDEYLTNLFSGTGTTLEGIYDLVLTELIPYQDVELYQKFSTQSLLTTQDLRLTSGFNPNSAAPVPEPRTMVMLLIGIMCLSLCRLRKSKQNLKLNDLNLK